MPATTAEYHLLCDSVATAMLSIRELPPIAIRDDLDKMRLKSFVFLCHAALEEYLERVTISALRRSRASMIESLRTPKILISAISHYQIKLKDVWSEIDQRPNLFGAIAGLADEAISLHEQAIYENHGIKTKDQDCLCMPIGIRVHSFDHALSQALNSYGENRGKIAHEFRINQVLPRVACEQNIQTLLQLLLPLDQEIERVSQEKW